MAIFKNSIVPLILFCSFLIPFRVHGAVVSLVGDADFSNNTGNSKTVGPQTGYGGGVLIGFPLAMRLGLETGLLYFNRNWSDTTSGTNSISSQVFEVPVILKIHLFRFFSIGAGGYYASNSGNLSESGSTNNSSLTYSAYGINPYDYGLLGNVSIHVPLTPGVLFRVDGNYQSGLVNVSSNTNNNFQYRDMSVLAGFTFYFMERGEHHK